MRSLVLLVALSFSASLLAQGLPAVPAGAEDGDIVEIEGELYEVWDGELTPIDMRAVAPVEGGADAELDAAGDLPVLEGGVTGSRVQSARNSAVRTDVVDQRTIEESGSRTLSDALQRVGGLQVTAATGTTENVSIDGLSGKYVKILIDGRPVNGTVNSQVDVSRLPISLSDVEKIEIVRGPMSALYGSDALGGVVNIVTRRASSRYSGDVELSSRLDGQGLQRSAFSARASGGNRLFALKLTASSLIDRATDRAFRYEADGDANGVLKAKLERELGSPVVDGQTIFRPDFVLDIPDKRQLVFTADSSLYVNDSWALRFYGNAQSSEVESRFANPQRVPFRDHTADTQFQLGVVAEGDLAPLHTLKIDTRIDRYLHRFEKLPDAGQVNPPPFCRHALGGTPFDLPCAADPRVRSNVTQDQSRTELIYTGVLAQKEPWAKELKLAVGTVLRYDEITRLNGDGEDTLPGGGQALLTAAYAELAYSIGELSLVPGARFESVFPGAADDSVAYALSPRVSARYGLPAGFAVRGSYGNAFRVPDFLERYLRFDHSELGYIVEGDPGLLPETNNGFRAEVIYEPVTQSGAIPLRLGAEVYLNLTDNRILAVPTGRFGGDGDNTSVPVFSYENLERAYTSGINLRANIDDVFGFGFDATYQYLIQAVNASGCPPDNPWFCSGAEGALSLPNQPIHAGHIGVRYTIDATDTGLFTQVDFQDERFMQLDLQFDPKRVAGFVNWRVGVRQQVMEKTEVLVVLENLFDHYDPVFGPKPGRSALVTLRAGF